MMMCLNRLAARACGSLCRLVDRRTSEKIVGIAVLGSDVKGDAMWHMPHAPASSTSYVQALDEAIMCAPTSNNIP